MKKTNFLLSILMILSFSSFSIDFAQGDIDTLKKIDASCDNTNKLNWDIATTSSTDLTGITANEYAVGGLNMDISSKELSDTLKLYKYSRIKLINCASNSLKSLNFSGIDIWEINCSENQITSLDFTNTSWCGTLNCSTNKLTKLNVSHNNGGDGKGGLAYFNCGDNLIDSLDLSKNNNLESVECYGNQLAYLNVSNDSLLQYLDCSWNQLEKMDFSSLKALKSLDCSNNFLTFSDLATLKAEPSEGFNYAPQGDVEETENFKIGDELNYSDQIGEYDGFKTIFKLYKKVNDSTYTYVEDSENAAGKFTATQNGVFKVTLTNKKFPDLTLNILDIKVGTSAIDSRSNDKRETLVYPNPVNDKLYIKDPILVKNIKVYSNDGKLLISTDAFTNGVDLSSYNTGIYIIKVEKDGKIQTTKIVKK